ncbi:MAG: hypothetical protein Q9213_006693 [Squamulea squamosa]
MESPCPRPDETINIPLQQPADQDLTTPSSDSRSQSLPNHEHKNQESVYQCDVKLNPSLWKSTFRALGLPMITHALGSLRHPMGKGFQEIPKIAIHRDRSMALLRVLVYLAPVGAALAEIIINWNTYYAGTAVYNLATYQVLAKLHELMMQASIATLIFSSIRSQFWPGGSTDIWLNTTVDDLWPNRTEALFVSTECRMLAPDQPINDCPASDWRSIRDGMSLVKQLLPLKYKEQLAETAQPDKIELHGRSSMRQLAIGTVAFANSHSDSIIATTQHAAISDALSNMAALWFLSLVNVTAGKSYGSPLSDQTIAQYTVLRDYKQPYSSVTCVPDFAVYPLDTIPIGVPRLLNANAAHLANRNMTYERSAGWGTAALSMYTSLHGVSALTSVVTGRAAEKSFTDPSPKLPVIITNQGFNSSSGLFNVQLPGYPEQLISISQEWAQYLNPTIAVMNTTVIDRLLQELLFACSPRKSAELALASLIVTSLAKSGAGSQLRDWAKFHVDSTLQGYAYNTTGLAPRIAIAFLTLYCFLALRHVFYAAYSGKALKDSPPYLSNACILTTLFALGISSTAWDSISEVTALAINSTPTAALRNTCAGITELRIFKLSVRVLVRNDVEGEGEYLELVFGDVDQEKVEDSTIKPNRVYGTMPDHSSPSNCIARMDHLEAPAASFTDNTNTGLLRKLLTAVSGHAAIAIFACGGSIPLNGDSDNMGYRNVTVRWDPNDYRDYYKISFPLPENDTALAGLVQYWGYIGFFCYYAYAHSAKSERDCIPSNLKGVDLAVYSAFCALELEKLFAGLKRARYGNSADFVEEHLDALGVPTKLDKEDAECDRWNYEYNENTRRTPGRYVSIVGTKMHEPRFCGGEDEELGRLGVIEEWECKHIPKIVWMNEAEHEEFAWAGIAYGNQAELEYKFSAAAIFVSIPSSKLRFAEPVAVGGLTDPTRSPVRGEEPHLNTKVNDLDQDVPASEE